MEQRLVKVFGKMSTKMISVIFLNFLWSQMVVAGVERASFTAKGKYLVVEFLDDDLVHFELSAIGSPPQLNKPLYTSPMVKKTDYNGPSYFSRNGMSMETSDIRVVVDPNDLTATVIDKTKSNLVLSSFGPRNLDSAWKGLNISPESFTHAYGLGQKFFDYNQPNGDLIDRRRESAGSQGNLMSGWDGGATGDTQIPVVFFAGAGGNSYGLFMDNYYKQTWDFSQKPWTADMWGDWLRWYVMTGDNLPDLRQDYMELTGTPPVPPKQAFGMWLSEYGFDDWAEVDNRVNSLKTHHFPLDGVVMDLQWFGGISNDDNTQMGSLTWDLNHFPNPAGKISDLKNREGIGMVLIEEPVVGKNLPSHAALANQGFLAKDFNGNPIYLNSNPWWGKGGYIDWSNPNARTFWHDLKREALIEDGIMGHWTDLGEPELYDSSAQYFGVRGDYRPLTNHGDIHNLYGLQWSQGIFEGYQNNGRIERPWILGRSGTAGIQRYGVTMWSGDIGGNLSSLNTHLNAQMHLAMSGVDYYGSDAGGFYRGNVSSEQMNEIYTVWFAHSTLLDVPVRPHVNNLCNCNESSPDRIGNIQANLENLRFRYEHGPYYYSLAHRAFRYGEPVFPPLVYYFQSDENVREMGDQKMIGKDLMVKTASASGVTSTDVYLPAGNWFNYRSNTFHESLGQYVNSVPTMEYGKFKLPIFVRGGAIIPLAYVDEQTGNILGKRRDGLKRDELIVKVFMDDFASQFTLYEDNGKDISYASGSLRTTLLEQVKSNDEAQVTIYAASGTYSNAISTRSNVVQLVTKSQSVNAVLLNRSPLKQFHNQPSFDAANSGWYHAGRNVIYAKSGDLDVFLAKEFVFQLNRS